MHQFTKRYEIRPKLLLMTNRKLLCAFNWHQVRWPWITWSKVWIFREFRRISLLGGNNS